MRIYLTLNEANEKHMDIKKYLDEICVDGKAEVLNIMYKVAKGINIYSNAPVTERIPINTNIPVEVQNNNEVATYIEIIKQNEPIEEQIDTSEFDDFF